MANQEYLNILKQGVNEWNQWRLKNAIKVSNTDETPEIDLSGADLTCEILANADLSNVNLANAELPDADLTKANLVEANLFCANLTDANLFDANLSYANLSYANLTRAYLSCANLSSAILFETKLSEANLIASNLNNANLNHAKLINANLSGSNLNGTDFKNVVMGLTEFKDVNFSNVKGLESVFHTYSSTISIDTIYRSEGNIPEVFLRGVGIPENLITFFGSLVGQPIQYYSCFISYSSIDQAFTEQLHADMQNKGVRCWFAPDDLKIGAKIRTAIDESIRIHDKLLLVLSEHSVNSHWVEQEVESAFARERKENRIVLFPIRIDNAVMKIDSGWPTLIKNTRNIGDFTKWKDNNSYQKAFDHLIRDLKADDSKTKE